ncbi:GNAT family N-acetyltransferase [Occultella glacieicola]|uniref:GNAT family N-acetyltransferase n=2 Tax=Occultella glacieicola TaxID=2518684 RepID=A0ABY2E2I9_9MICO|nr:GNAT family N-acetyltransferase [Occultella glacieicola]
MSSERGPGENGAPEPAGGAVELRPAGPPDAAEIARIWGQGWADAHLGHVPPALVEARTAASFLERVPEVLTDTVVAERAGAVIGFVTIEGDQVDQLYLDRAARGGGIGSALLRAGERAVIAAGHDRAWLAVATGNTAARRFYERQGWIDDGRFVHPAPVPGGAVPVDAHRFLSPRRR